MSQPWIFGVLLASLALSGLAQDTLELIDLEKLMLTIYSFGASCEHFAPHRVDKVLLAVYKHHLSPDKTFVIASNFCMVSDRRLHELYACSCIRSYTYYNRCL